MYRISELKQFLEEIGQGPKKSLSQNFLIDGNIVRKIADSAGVDETSLVLEIGPGPGALTQELLKRGAEVIAVEMDRVLAAQLPRLDSSGKLHVFESDILKFDFAKHLDPLLKGRKVKVVANLPYHITTPILTTLVTMPERFESLTCMVQHEVAERFTASAGSKLFGSISLYLHYYSDPHYSFKVPKKCFYPAPKVDSAIVTLFLKKSPAVRDEEFFFKLVRHAFNHRRKMLKKSLKELVGAAALEEALQKASIPMTARPEDLGLQEWLRFTDALSE